MGDEPQASDAIAASDGCGGVKYEDVCIHDYLDGLELGRGLPKWFRDYHEHRSHESLDLECPGDMYRNPQAHGARAKAR